MDRIDQELIATALNQVAVAAHITYQRFASDVGSREALLSSVYLLATMLDDAIGICERACDADIDAIPRTR